MTQKDVKSPEAHILAPKFDAFLEIEKKTQKLKNPEPHRLMSSPFRSKEIDINFGNRLYSRVTDVGRSENL